MRYRTGWGALQVPDENGNSDWHSIGIDSDWRETDDTWGIRKDFAPDGKPTATRVRAMIDIVEGGNYLSLYDIVDDLMITEDVQLQFCEKVYERWGLVISTFMWQEFPVYWRQVLSENGLDYPTTFLDKAKKYKEERGYL